jgi:two-component system response regulator LytT
VRGWGFKILRIGSSFFLSMPFKLHIPIKSLQSNYPLLTLNITHMKALIIEDEKPAARRIIKLLLEVDPTIEILTILDSVESSIEWLSKNPAPEIMFLDIHLSDGSSFDILKKTNAACPIIFITAYDEYAIDAFKVNSVDYLLKPVKIQDLESALLKFTNLKNSYSSIGVENLVNTVEKKYKDRFVIKLGNRIKSIMIDDIAYFFSRDKLTFICDNEGKNSPIDISLDKLEKLLDPNDFFRVNRQIISKASSIRDIQTSSKSRIILTLDPPSVIEAVISSERSSIFKKWLKKE